MKSKAEYIKRRGTDYRQLRSGAAMCMQRLLRHNFHISFARALDKAIFEGSDHFEIRI